MQYSVSGNSISACAQTAMILQTRAQPENRGPHLGLCWVTPGVKPGSEAES